MSLGRTFETNNIYVEKKLTDCAYKGTGLNFVKVMEYNKYSEYDYIDWGILVWIKIPTRKEFVVIAKYNYITNQLVDWFQENEAWLDFHTTEHTAQSLNLLNKGISKSRYVMDLNLASLKARLRLNNADFVSALRILVNNDVKSFKTLRKNNWTINRYNRGKCTIASNEANGQKITICIAYCFLHYINIDGVDFYTDWCNYSRTSAKYTNLAGGDVRAEKNAAGNYDYITSNIYDFQIN